ncbi:MAG: D-3-phosphoglycerate dehydrogenase (EC [uncultured Aureispira sp.]|uniref:D-3-phosphoglycerate dehydrogenase (EC) n=1 Tax=uncultured Aureispira sp. TaxID=1331704 RepID=A0A6S6SQE4_9BACT|nr:MAG: D-3-phosphoglycerate dehydrogenase (EC [uncultured Aureispira sp.]
MTTKEQPRVLITDGVHPLLINGLTAAGYYCDYMPSISLEDVRAIISQYQGIIINSKITVDRPFLDDATQLKFIGRLGSGLEIIDLEYAKAKQVAVHRAPDGNCDAVAEHAMGMLLSLAINLRRSDQQVRQKNWQREQNRGWELMGKTVGIVGFGYTGIALAKRLIGFGVRVLVYDKYKSNYAKEMPHVIETDMEQIQEEADVLSLHLPSTPETKGLVDGDYWKKFKKPLVLVNTSRGNIVQTKALLEALDSGQIIGACLDVLENEKPVSYTKNENLLFQDLFARENVLVTPHIAGWTVESKERLADLLLDRIMKQ